MIIRPPVWVTPEWIRWAARRIVDQHNELPDEHRCTGHCAQCEGDTRCPLLAWALLVVAAPRPVPTDQPGGICAQQ